MECEELTLIPFFRVWVSEGCLQNRLEVSMAARNGLLRTVRQPGRLKATSLQIEGMLVKLAPLPRPEDGH